MSNYISAVVSKKDKIVTNITLALMGVDGVLMIVEMSVHNIVLGGLMIASAVGLALPKQFFEALANVEKFQRKYKINIYSLVFVILAIVCALDFASAPAHAQFFNNAQTWMKKVFDNGNNANTGEVVDLFFNVLRGLFLLYVGVSLVRIVQAAQRDEDWQSLARTPLIIVLAVFVGDLVTALIVPKT